MLLVKKNKRHPLRNAKAHGIRFFIEEIVGYCDVDSRILKVTYRPDGLKKWIVRMEAINHDRKVLIGVGDTMEEAFEKAIEGEEPYLQVGYSPTSQRGVFECSSE